MIDALERGRREQIHPAQGRFEVPIAASFHTIEPAFRALRIAGWAFAIITIGKPIPTPFKDLTAHIIKA